MSTGAVSSYRASARSLWDLYFHFQGNFLCALLPFCVLNCCLLGLVEFLAYENKEIGFSPTGHGLLTILVSFLVISKVNLAYERNKRARYHVGSAYLHLRELHQLCIALTINPIEPSSPQMQKEQQYRMQQWRTECLEMILQIMEATKTVVQQEKVARFFASNVEYEMDARSYEKLCKNDPYRLAQSLRILLYAKTTADLQLLERVQLMGKLNEYVVDYKHLLELASTPLPAPLVSMGRTFLFIWTFSMPLVLRQGPFTDFWTAEVFLFFLTYGFVGLELVSMKLEAPFGDGVHDIRVSAIRDAAVVGMEQDLEGMDYQTIDQRRLAFSQQHIKGGIGDGGANDQAKQDKDKYVDPASTSEYRAMGGHDHHDMIPWD